MLKRFYITLVLWVLAICALGLYARTSPHGLSIVLLGILPLGFGFILLLLFYVPGAPSQVLTDYVGQSNNQEKKPVVDWGGTAAVYPVVPHHQYNSIEWSPKRPILRLVHSKGLDNTFLD